MSSRSTSSRAMKLHTLGDLFHRTAEIVEPLYERLLRVIAEKGDRAR